MIQKTGKTVERINATNSYFFKINTIEKHFSRLRRKRNNSNKS